MNDQYELGDAETFRAQFRGIMGRERFHEVLLKVQNARFTRGRRLLAQTIKLWAPSVGADPAEVLATVLYLDDDERSLAQS